MVRTISKIGCLTTFRRDWALNQNSAGVRSLWGVTFIVLHFRVGLKTSYVREGAQVDPLRKWCAGTLFRFILDYCAWRLKTRCRQRLFGNVILALCCGKLDVLIATCTLPSSMTQMFLVTNWSQIPSSDEQFATLGFELSDATIPCKITQSRYKVSH